MQGIQRDSIIVGAVAAAVALAGVAMVYLPNTAKLRRIEEQVLSVKTALEQDGEKAAVVPELTRQVQAMKSKFQDFDRRLPRRQELGGFLRQVSEALAVENVSNQTIEPGKPAPEDLFYTQPIVMRFRGTYLSLARFLERIDRFDRVTRVQKLSISSNPGETLLDITVQMNIYFTES